MDLKTFYYTNLFPADVSSAGAFLLCLLNVTPPMEERALRRILKCLVTDDRAASILPALLSGGYVVMRATGQGRFYTLTAKALAYLDFEHKEKHHKARSIPDKALLTYRLKGELIAAKIVHIAARLFVEAAGDDVVQGDLPTSPFTTSTIDLFSRSLVPPQRVVHAVADGIGKGEIPFIASYNTALYAGSDSPLMHAMENYDAARLYQMKLLAGRKLPGEHPTPDQARAYLKRTREIEAVEPTVEKLLLMCTLCTYHHGQKPMSLALLDANGLFVEQMDSTSIRLGLINNAPLGLPVDTLARRLDYCATLADHLGLTPAVVLYTLPEDNRGMERRITLAMEKAAPLPVQTVFLPDKLPAAKWLVRRENSIT